MTSILRAVFSFPLLRNRLILLGYWRRFSEIVFSMKLPGELMFDSPEFIHFSMLEG